MYTDGRIFPLRLKVLGAVVLKRFLAVQAYISPHSGKQNLLKTSDLLAIVLVSSIEMTSILGGEVGATMNWKQGFASRQVASEYADFYRSNVSVTSIYSARECHRRRQPSQCSSSLEDVRPVSKQPAS